MQPQTVSQLFPSKWLKADDLGSGKVVTITDCKIELLKAFQSTEKEAKLTIGFKSATKRLIATKSQCLAIAEIAGTEEFAKWPGLKVALLPQKLPTGKYTILVKAAPTNGAQPPPQPEPPATIQPVELFAPAEVPAPEAEAQPVEEIDF